MGFLWTEEALRRVENAPEFVRPGIYKLMLKRAKERGVRVITSEFLTEIRNESMMLVAKRIKGFGVETLSMDAFKEALERMKGSNRKVEVIREITSFLEKRTKKNEKIIAKFKDFLEVVDSKGIPWERDALEGLSSIPEPMRAEIKKTIEKDGARNGYKIINRQFVEEALKENTLKNVYPEGALRGQGESGEAEPCWTEEARERVQRIPIAPIRNKVIKAVEDYACSRGHIVINNDVVESAIKEKNLSR